MYSFSSPIICTLGNSFCISDDYFVYISNKIFNNDNNNKHIPRLIKGLYDIKIIDCGIKHILCLDFDGSVFSFGENDDGQLGIGQDFVELKRIYIPQKVDIPPCKQIACGYYFSICLTENNLLYSFGSNMYEQLGLDNNDDYNSSQLIPNIHNIEYIVCGGFHSICKTYDNIYYGWGCNDFGQLGYEEPRNYN